MTWSCYFQTFIHEMMMHFNLRLTTYIQHIGRGGRNGEMHRDAFCTSIAPAFGVQTFQRKLKSIVGVTLRRQVLWNSHFGFTDPTATVQICCDICENFHPTSVSDGMNSEKEKVCIIFLRDNIRSGRGSKLRVYCTIVPLF